MVVNRVTKDDLIKIYEYIDKHKSDDNEELIDFFILVKKLHATYNFLLMRCQELIKKKGNVSMLEVELDDLRNEYNELKRKYDKDRTRNALEKERKKSTAYYNRYKEAVKTIDALKKQLNDEKK